MGYLRWLIKGTLKNIKRVGKIIITGRYYILAGTIMVTLGVTSTWLMLNRYSLASLAMLIVTLIYAITLYKYFITQVLTEEKQKEWDGKINKWASKKPWTAKW